MIMMLKTFRFQVGSLDAEEKRREGGGRGMRDQGKPELDTHDENCTAGH